jgi:NADH:ubiquinone oxidoreductase subunit 3 (subunit A)
LGIFVFLVLAGVLIALLRTGGKMLRTTMADREPRHNHVYILAALFVVFDMTMIFVFPWAVKFKVFGVFVPIEMLIFLAPPVLGFVWIWKKGGLEWS